MKILDFVTDDAIFRAPFPYAMFYSLPSLYEGFGLPVLEAMA